MVYDLTVVKMTIAKKWKLKITNVSEIMEKLDPLNPFYVFILF